MTPRRALWGVFMRRSISSTPSPNRKEPDRMRHSSIIKKASLAYGACCSLATCAVLLLMLSGRQSPLGHNLALLFLTVFWSGVPLLPLSIQSLKGRCTTRIACGAALLLSVAPAAICLFYPLVKICFFGGNYSLGIAPSIVLLFAPVVISLILLLLLIPQCFPEKRQTSSRNRD
jgi:hypothetical protein